VLCRHPHEYGARAVCRQYAGPVDQLCCGQVPRCLDCPEGREVFRVVKGPLGWECRGYSPEALQAEMAVREGFVDGMVRDG
jgi:hypothetical protein